MRCQRTQHPGYRRLPIIAAYSITISRSVLEQVTSLLVAVLFCAACHERSVEPPPQLSPIEELEMEPCVSPARPQKGNASLTTCRNACAKTAQSVVGDVRAMVNASNTLRLPKESSVMRRSMVEAVQRCIALCQSDVPSDQGECVAGARELSDIARCFNREQENNR